LGGVYVSRSVFRSHCLHEGKRAADGGNKTNTIKIPKPPPTAPIPQAAVVGLSIDTLASCNDVRRLRSCLPCFDDFMGKYRKKKAVTSNN